MSKRFFISSVLLLLFLGSTAARADEAGPKARVKGPITVTSESLTNDNKKHTALFERNVVAKTTDMMLYADQMLVYYTEGSGDVTKIEATGNVKLYKDTRLITSQFATYYADEDKVIFSGEPRAVDGENVVTGSKMTYHIRDDISEVEKSRVFLKNNKER